MKLEDVIEAIEHIHSGDGLYGFIDFQPVAQGILIRPPKTNQVKTVGVCIELTDTMMRRVMSKEIDFLTRFALQCLRKKVFILGNNVRITKLAISILDQAGSTKNGLRWIRVKIDDHFLPTLVTE